MAPNKAIVFNSIPDGWPIPGQDLIVKDIGGDPSAPAPSNGLVIEVLHLSFDPYLRGRMRASNIQSYVPAFTLHAPIENSGIGRVLKSDRAGFAAGDVVEGVLPFAEIVVAEEGQSSQISKLVPLQGVDLRYYLGALGMPGRTAYSSLYAIGKPKKGETIFISAASGAVGQIVGQLAKHEGLKVVGSVGSDDKLKHIVENLGYDGGFNYKNEKPSDALTRLAPEGIDIYYDNVGGEQLDAALLAANNFARFVMCGMISEYSSKDHEKYSVKNLGVVFGKRIELKGFIVLDEHMGPKYHDEHREKVGAWIKDGSFNISQSVTNGIEKGPEAFIGMLRGENFGKTILTVKE